MSVVWTIVKNVDAETYPLEGNGIIGQAVVSIHSTQLGAAKAMDKIYREASRKGCVGEQLVVMDEEGTSIKSIYFSAFSFVKKTDGGFYMSAKPLQD